MKFDIRVDSEHLPYLFLQKGNLDNLKHDRAAWLKAYQEGLANQFKSILPSLPTECFRFLDVGSGLGGIDVLIRRHYEETALTQPDVALLDGVDDPPEMTLHRQTFCNLRIARNFQVKNGLSPNKFWYYGPDVKSFEEPFDLIVSFGSWGFHYPPSWYLPALRAGALLDDTVLILDLRKDKPEWRAELEEVFAVEGVAADSRKWERLVLRVRG